MSELNFKVDRERCIKCGLCKTDCITQIINFDSDGYPVIEDEKSCIKCQHCLAICPRAAISILDKNPDESFICNQIPNADQVEHLIKSRRSCRNFKQENVEKSTIDKLKNILNWTPTGVNFRDLHFTFVENKETMAKIKKDLYKTLTTVLKFMPVPKGLKKYKDAVLSGEDVIFRNAPHMVVVSSNKKAPCQNIDPIIALSTFELYAQSLGVGTLWCGLAYSMLPMNKNVMKMLDIPKTHKLGYVMLFGYPQHKYARSVQPDEYKITSI